jgi:NAD(P)-dependent dehydrogenase (short-subunit alcohol dehydrogenase family)
VREAFDTISETFGGVDIVVSNAGAAWQGRIGEVGEAVDVTDYMSGNLLGREVTAGDVAQAFLASAQALKTTADVTTVDGGNIDAALR